MCTVLNIIAKQTSLEEENHHQFSDIKRQLFIMTNAIPDMMEERRLLKHNQCLYKQEDVTRQNKNSYHSNVILLSNWML